MNAVETAGRSGTYEDREVTFKNNSGGTALNYAAMAEAAAPTEDFKAVETED